MLFFLDWLGCQKSPFETNLTVENTDDIKTRIVFNSVNNTNIVKILPLAHSPI